MYHGYFGRSFILAPHKILKILMCVLLFKVCIVQSAISALFTSVGTYKHLSYFMDQLF